MLANPNPIRRSTDDRLGRSPFAAAIGNIIRNGAGYGTVVIGVEGVWGSGKSSVLQFVGEQVRRDTRNRVVTVSAWRTTSQDQFLANLSYSIATELRRDWQDAYWRIAWAKLCRQSLPMLVAIFVPLLTIAALIAFPDVRSWTKALVDDPKKFAESLGLFGLPVLGVAFSKLSQPVLDGLRSLMGKNGTDAIGAMERFAYDFDVLGAAQPRGTRFLVMVEDLDRCAPAQVTGVLSAIAQMQGHPKSDRIAFLLAYDRAILLKSIEQDAVKHLTEGVANAAVLARDYLDRVVQLELPLPDPEPAAEIASPPRRWWSLSPLVRGFLLSTAIVSFGLYLLATTPVSRWAGWAITLTLFVLVGESVADWLSRGEQAAIEPPQWQEAVEAGEGLLRGFDHRSRARVLNQASAAILLRPDAGLTSFEALSIAVLATRWPEAFDRGTLEQSPVGQPLDIATAFRNKEVTDAIGQIEQAHLPIGQFRNREKLLAVVSAIRR